MAQAIAGLLSMSSTCLQTRYGCSCSYSGSRFGARPGEVLIVDGRRGQMRDGNTRRRGLVVRAVTQEKETEKETPSAESTARKFGLEAGLWQIWTSKDGNTDEAKGKKKSQAKELLTRYGGAYLATSISLSLISFSLCYVLVDAGVDLPSLLEKVGIHANATGEKVGTFALAYAAHKAASPIRFPPTVALTPVVASWFGKKPAAETKDDSQS